MRKPRFYEDDVDVSLGRRRSPFQEKQLAKRGGGRRVPGSGSGVEKGDVRRYNGVFRIEAKTTQAASFRVTREMMGKIEEAALNNRELPAIIIEFLDELGRPVCELAVVPSYVLDSITSE